jgi:hypothetical protein
VVLEGLLDAPGGRGTDALVDHQCVPQMRGGLPGFAVLEVAVAESFQGAGFLGGRAEAAGYGECLGVMLAGLAGS